MRHSIFYHIALLLCLTLIISMYFPPAALSQDVREKVSDKLTPLPAGSARFTGYLGGKIDICLEHRVLAQDLGELIDPFRKREEKTTWQCEFWGKWFTSVVPAYKYKKEERIEKLMREAVNQLLSTQTPDGYIGTYTDTTHLGTWDVWGRKYTLLGLLQYYEITGNRDVLKAAMRHADHLLSEVGPGKADIEKLGMWHGLASCSILEPITLLYRYSGERRYLEFAGYILDRWKAPDGPDLIQKALSGVSVGSMFSGPEPGRPIDYDKYGDLGTSKAYEMMSCYEGLCELYRMTGDETFFEAARLVFDNILETEITAAGSGSDWERWIGGRFRQTEPVRYWMETCVSATWIKFAYQLLRLTGDSKYADEIERSAYNILAAALKNDGSYWCHYTPLAGERYPARPQVGMKTMNCCVASGPRALMLLPSIAVMSASDGPAVNLYLPGTAKIPLQGDAFVEMQTETDYPRSGAVTIVLNPSRETTFMLSLRIPAWSTKTDIIINGRDAVPARPGAYAKISRAWKKGDTIQLSFDMRGRALSEPGTKGYCAIMRGPLLLAADRRLGAGTISGDALLVADSERHVELLDYKNPLPPGIWLSFEAPFRNGRTGEIARLPLCDFSSAGNTWSEESLYRAWMPQPLSTDNLFDIQVFMEK